MEQLAERLATAAEQGKAVEHSLSANLEVFAGRLAASRQALDTTYEQVSVLTEASVRLLELIRASADHGRVDLPAALSDAERSLVSVEKRLETMRAGVGDARANGEDLNAAVANANEGLAKARAEISRLHEIIAQHSTEHGQTLDGLALRLARIGEETTGIAEKSQSALTAAIVQLQGAASEAVASIDRDSAQAITQVATRLGEESGAVLDKVMRMRAAETVGQLEQAAAHAAGVSREAALQLRDQLAKVNELAGNLEARVAQARSKAQEQVDNAFARRAALITDSLNSNAIDIAKALSSDVADTAWAAYLRGDRGIFTRRAVSLLDNSEARAISHIYEHDLEFRDHVSRYIHDFEGMLRQLLSTRDGHALGVTLLSSDMGKLYVALAQAIERLRK